MTLRENLQHDAVEALRVLEPAEIEEDGVVSEAIRLMRERSIGCVVVTRNGSPVGILTERDILTKVVSENLPGRTAISAVMTSPAELLQEGCSVSTVIQRMHKGGFRHMPVVDASNKLLGVVSIKGIVEYIVEHFPSAVFNVPPDEAPEQVAREGA